MTVKERLEGLAKRLDELEAGDRAWAELPDCRALYWRGKADGYRSARALVRAAMADA